MASVVDVVTSTPVLDAAAADLKLDQNPEFNPALRRNNADVAGSGILGILKAMMSEAISSVRNLLYPAAFEDTHLTVLAAVKRALDVSVKGASHTIRLQATARDPRLAAQLANAIAEAALHQQIAANAEDANRAKTWLDDRLRELGARVAQSEEETERLRADTGRFEGQTATILSEELSQISKELLEARTQLAAARAKRDEMVRLGQSPAGLATANDVLGSPTINRLRQQEAEISGQLAADQSHLGPQHPNLIALRSQLGELRRSINQETNRISRDVSSRVQSLEFQVSEIERAKAKLETRIEGQRTSEVRLKDLQADVNSNRTTLEAFAIFRAKMAGLPSIERPDLEIVSLAQPAPIPIWPNRKSVLLVAGLGALVIACFVSILRVALDQGLRSTQQVGAVLGLTTVAFIPLARSRRDPAAAILAAPTSPLAESIRHLYTAVDAARAGSSGFRVLITSAVPREGKSVTALMLARQASLVGIRTLLVRLDLRTAPRLAEQANEYETEITNEVETRLSIFTVHTCGENGFKALYRRAFWETLEEACTRFDLVIIDSPPVLSVSDAKIITRFADMTIFLVKWGSTKHATAAEAVRQLHLAGAAVDSAVLTQVDPRRLATYGHGDSGLYVGAYPVYYRDS
jgi:uncharacterized protein involved in exopolysaccharide biosynthesis/Mrp family chromosome partitioning ATPase